ncbi:rhomboid family intramembrane serine protease [Planctomicrobium sp. SH527]|uniref:rhomboid family intramembrane serine protease n=1 Tax=Planctomicrobium sp. SH527 TaxID=3448123 RepID=UPI003F5C4031
MDLNLILIWTIAASCGLFLVQSSGNQAARPLVYVNIGLLILLAVLARFHFESAGYITGIFWAVLTVLPGILNSLIIRLQAKPNRFPAAYCLSVLLSWIHPFNGQRHLPRFMKAVKWLDSGNSQQAIQTLNELRQYSHPIGQLSLIVWARSTGEWQGLLDQLKLNAVTVKPNSDFLVLEGYLQALGETGRRNEMLHEYQRLILSQTETFVPSDFARLNARIAGYCGDPLLVATFVNQIGEASPAGMLEYWTGTAYQVAGDYERALEQFNKLLETKEHVLDEAIQRRLANPVPPLSKVPIEPDAERVLYVLRNFHWTLQPRHRARTKSPLWATKSLLVILTMVFIAEIPGGTEDFDNLVSMGAMLIPVEFNQGDWWRPITAAFLHFGPLHFALNALGLYALGKHLERLWGPWRFTITYLTAAIGALYLTPYFMENTFAGGITVLLGASGGVLGLIGGLVVQTGLMLIRGWSKPLANTFVTLLVIIVLQTYFDHSMENVSSEAHLLGMGIGALFGVFWNIFSWRRLT